MPVIAPVDFMEFTVSENVYAGNAMNRRLFYQYGLLLPASPYGYVGQGWSSRFCWGHGPDCANPLRGEGHRGVPGRWRQDGVPEHAEHRSAAGDEHLHPDMKALWMAENVIASLHNSTHCAVRQCAIPCVGRIYRGSALPLRLRGGGNARLTIGHAGATRHPGSAPRPARSLRSINNQVLHLANKGVTINEIHNVYGLPKGLQDKWFCRGYHGSAQHNSRGVVQRYLGFWDCNPTTLIPLSPGDSAPLYVEMMGGADNIMARGRALHDEGKYLLASEIVNKLVQAEPDNEAAKDLLADILEQLGYQQENPGLRNSFLAAAYELRSGIPQGETANSSSPDVIRQCPRALPQLSRHSYGQPQSRGDEVHDQPNHAGQRREIPDPA